MNVLLGIAGAAALFVVFGLLRRGREPEGHEGCSGCASNDCQFHPSHARPTDVHS